MEIIYFMFSSFWVWLGTMIIMGAIADFIFSTYQRALRHRTIMKHGYPPEHCDVDGEFKEPEDEI